MADPDSLSSRGTPAVQGAATRPLDSSVGRLEETESLFFDAIMPGRTAALAAIERTFPASPSLTSTERVGIYREMILWRQIDGLREDFPNLASLLGDEVFDALATDYLAAHPSQHPSISYLGRNLSAFLKEQHQRFSRGDLADLAELEWTRSLIFEELPGVAIEASGLVDLPAEVITASRFRFIPALTVRTFGHDVVEVFRQLARGADEIPAFLQRTVVVIWRPEFEVFHVRIGPEEAEALALARGGATVAEICAPFAALAAPAEAAFKAIGEWFKESWISAVDLPT